MNYILSSIKNKEIENLSNLLSNINQEDFSISSEFEKILILKFLSKNLMFIYEKEHIIDKDIINEIEKIIPLFMSERDRNKFLSFVESNLFYDSKSFIDLKNSILTLFIEMEKNIRVKREDRNIELLALTYTIVNILKINFP